MNNFTYHVPTKIYFGKDQLFHLEELKESGHTVLLVYRGGSIRKLGIYDQALGILNENGIKVFELNGIESNPKVEKVEEGIRLCRKEHIEMVLAIGGGSVIDSAKAIAAGTLYEGPIWDLVKDSSKIKAALPIYTVLTISAAGSEMNKNAVLSDMSHLKESMSSDLLKPKMSILDPTYTCNVSLRQTAAGTADMLSHAFENYFTPVRSAYLGARFSEAVLKTIFHYGRIVMEEPDNYEARANLMWASTNAINGITKGGGDVGWSCHPIEHELSAHYDVVHGEGLAIITPRWLKKVLNKDTLWKFADFGRNVFDLEGNDQEIAEKAIVRTAEFLYETLKLPKTLQEIGIGEEKLELMAEHAAKSTGRAFVPLGKDDILEIYRSCLKEEY